MIRDLVKSQKERNRSVSRSRDTDPRRDDIEKVYASERYKNYVRAMPKHRRQSRDPMTPDRKSTVSSTVWSEKISAWKSDLDRWGQKRGDTPSSRIKDANVKHDLVNETLRF